MAGELAKPGATGIEAAAAAHGIEPAAMRDFVMRGELTGIPAAQQFSILMALCTHVGIDPLERPFMVLRETKWTKQDGRWVSVVTEKVYATRRCTSALCRERKISREIVSTREITIAGHQMIEVRARATMASSGRYDEATGVVPVMRSRFDKQKDSKVWENPSPDDAANLPMKAETKAKRRAVLDLVGLGLTDESELETMGGKVERVTPLQLAQEAERPHEEPDPYMTGKLASKAAKTMARCAQIAAAKATDDKLVTPRQVWEAACAKFKGLPPMPDGSTPKIENLRKSIAWPICDLIKKWAADLEPPTEPERQPGEDRSIDDEPVVDVEWTDEDATAKGAP